MNAIKDLREKYELTQAALSELTNIPLRTIQSWELGERKAPAYVYELVREFLHNKFDAEDPASKMGRYDATKEDKVIDKYILMYGDSNSGESAKFDSVKELFSFARADMWHKTKKELADMYYLVYEFDSEENFEAFEDAADPETLCINCFEIKKSL